MAFFSASYSPWSDHAATAVVAATWKGRKAGRVISEGNNGDEVESSLGRFERWGRSDEKGILYGDVNVPPPSRAMLAWRASFRVDRPDARVTLRVVTFCEGRTSDESQPALAF